MGFTTGGGEGIGTAGDGAEGLIGVEAPLGPYAEDAAGRQLRPSHLRRTSGKSLDPSEAAHGPPHDQVEYTHALHRSILPTSFASLFFYE